MKDLSGFEPDQQPNYEEQTAKELDKVQSKAILLNDMLNSTDEGKTIGRDGDEYDQVARAVRAARPKIQKWIAEVSEDAPDSLDRLLLMNDLINGVLERFEECKRGDWAKGRGVDVSQYTAPPAAEPSLISFDAFADSPPAGASIALPHTNDGAASSSSSIGASGMLGGLPADLFSAPSPAATNSASGQLDFFASAPAAAGSSSGQPLQAKKAIDLSALYQQGFGGASSAAAPGAFNGGGAWGAPAQHQQQQQQQQRPTFGGAMAGQQQQPFGQFAAGASNGSGSTTTGAGQGQKKADPFEGLLF